MSSHFLLAQESNTGMKALVAVVVIVAGFIIGSIVAAIVRKLASKDSRPEAITSSAGALATLGFSIALITALVIALGIVNRQALDQLTSDLVSFLPRALSATIVLILGNVVGAVAETGVSRSLGHVSPSLRERVPSIVKWIVSGFAAVIAANQLGVDTTIIVVAVSAIFFGIALTAAMLAGLGGKEVAGQIAAGRALRRILKPGDQLTAGTIEGVVTTVGSTSTQVTRANDVLLVPNDALLHTQMVVTPADDDVAPVELSAVEPLTSDDDI